MTIGVYHLKTTRSIRRSPTMLTHALGNPAPVVPDSTAILSNFVSGVCRCEHTVVVRCESGAGADPEFLKEIQGLSFVVDRLCSKIIRIRSIT